MIVFCWAHWLLNKFRQKTLLKINGRFVLSKFRQLLSKFRHYAKHIQAAFKKLVNVRLLIKIRCIAKQTQTVAKQIQALCYSNSGAVLFKFRLFEIFNLEIWKYCIFNLLIILLYKSIKFFILFYFYYYYCLFGFVFCWCWCYQK